MRALAFLILAIPFIVSCGSIPGTVKVYYLEPEDGLVRKQAQDPDPKIIPFSKAKGYLCESRTDFENTVTCVGGGVKIYSLQPELGGLYRKQANELILFAAARGYLCVTPADFQQILDKCAAEKTAAK